VEAVRIRCASAAALGLLVCLLAPIGTARAMTLEVRGRQALSDGYERVFGIARGRVASGEPVRGLPPAGLSYAVEFELIRPTHGPRAQMLLVEAENRGSPLLLDALLELNPAVSGPPSTASYPPSAGAFLRHRRLAYARVQWQTGVAGSVPATAQGVGEVIIRDFGRALAKTYRRRALVGVSQGAFFVDTFLAEGFNALPGGGRSFTQMLTVDGNGNWMTINELAGATPQNPYLLPNGRPLSYRQLLRRPNTDPLLVDVANYTDFYRLRAGLTDRIPLPANVRRYDWPSPHQSFSADVVFNGLRCNNGVAIPLNPLNYSPYLRALVVGMSRGVLPRSRRFALGPAPRTSPGFNGLPAVRVPVPAVDSRSQPIAGVRFPDLELPLGALRPVSLAPAVTTSSVAVCGNSGGFTPFAPSAIRRRYSRSRYLERYGKLVGDLISGGYVLASDRVQVLREAASQYDHALAGTLGR
jgi:Alpha/beta hydrolase domain